MAARFAFNRISPEARSILRDFGRLADETRESVLAVVGNGLNAFRESPLRELMNPTSLRPNVDLGEIIESGKCVVVSCVERSFGNSTLPLLMAVKEAFADLILSRKDIERESATETWIKINQHREILYIADECHRLVTRGDSGGELDFLDLCREFNCRAILATQSLSALESVMGTKASDRLVALFGHHVFLSNIDPSTAAWADRMFDTGQDKLFPPPLLRTNSRHKKMIDWRGSQTLASLRTGEFIIRTRDGDHYRRRGHLG
jgi:Type IV secretion-system coupling protein DNA-binding domain